LGEFGLALRSTMVKEISNNFLYNNHYDLLDIHDLSMQHFSNSTLFDNLLYSYKVNVEEQCLNFSSLSTSAQNACQCAGKTNLELIDALKDDNNECHQYAIKKYIGDALSYASPFLILIINFIIK